MHVLHAGTRVHDAPAILDRHKVLEQIGEYPFKQVREKILLEGSVPTERIDDAIMEFRKYLALIALGHRGIGMVSREVDEVWHTFILFTKDYAEFCESVFGYFVHHQPGVPSQPLGPEPRERFLHAYRENFGELNPIWGVCAEQCFGTCDTPSTNCQDPPCK